MVTLAFNKDKLLDPEGVEQRRAWRLGRRHNRSKGPNTLNTHMDGHDKLKPFGIAISGCILVFSATLCGWRPTQQTTTQK